MNSFFHFDFFLDIFSLFISKEKRNGNKNSKITGQNLSIFRYFLFYSVIFQPKLSTSLSIYR